MFFPELCINCLAPLKLQNSNWGIRTLAQILCLEMILSNFPLSVTDFLLWTR